MRPESVEILARFVRTRSGLSVGQEKAYLFRTRLEPVARKRGFETVDDLAAHLRSRGKDVDAKLAGDVVDAMATNETSFFRDRTPFERLKDVAIPHVVAKRSVGPLRIWSAACSTGQEPYSIAMLLEENRQSLNGRPYRIVGTDISNYALERARDGVYSRHEIRRGLSDTRLKKFFEPADGEAWQVRREVRKNVDFRYLNLLARDFGSARFDIVFCRNVLIYLDRETRKGVFERIEKTLNPGGLLFLGASETPNGITDRFRPFPKTHGVFYAAAHGEPNPPTHIGTSAPAGTRASRREGATRK